ncbi:SA1362 family protein [Bacillus bingmayongensis]|uniref:SA1362 family protein n=1 Tax=Bacillus bingmayongensis TaxID=1150157 RepID=UPI0035AB75DB
MNGRSFTFALFVLIIGLAIFGLVSSAITDPYGMVKNIVIMLLVVGVFYLLYKMFTSSSGSANSQNSYKRAAKQSNRKYGKQNVAPLSNSLLKRNASDDKVKKGNSLNEKKLKRKTALPFRKCGISFLQTKKETHLVPFTFPALHLLFEHREVFQFEVHLVQNIVLNHQCGQ